MRSIGKMKIYLLIVVILNSQIIWCMEYKDNGGYKMPVLGLGTRKPVTNDSELINALNKALEIGYRHIDTAARYANENIIGKVLKEWISTGKVKREDLFITTKLADTDLFPDHVEKALKTSLEKLQLDYVDLYLIHLPVATTFKDGKLIAQPSDHISVWKKMEEQVEAGRTRTIGLSNFNISQIERIQKIAKIQPTTLQVELHLYFQQKELRDFAMKNNMTVVAYAPLGAPYIKSTQNTEDKLHSIFSDEVVTKIAQKYKKSNAQIALRFIIQSGLAAIPRSTNPKRLNENFDIFDFTLDDKEMKVLESLDKGKKAKIFNMKHVVENIIEHPEYPFYENL